MKITPVLKERSYEKIHTFYRTDAINYGVLCSSSSASALFQLYFSLAQLNSYTDFTGLFDQYRISRVRIRVYFSQTQSLATLQTSTTTPNNNTALMCYQVVDYDDAATTSLANLIQYENCESKLCLGKVTDIVIKPRIAVAAYSGTFTSYANVKNQWLDSASPNVQYYGFKLGIDLTPLNYPITAVTIGTIYFILDYEIQCRNPR